jgi:hypothetical protein
MVSAVSNSTRAASVATAARPTPSVARIRSADAGRPRAPVSRPNVARAGKILQDVLEAERQTAARVAAPNSSKAISSDALLALGVLPAVHAARLRRDALEQVIMPLARSMTMQDAEARA